VAKHKAALLLLAVAATAHADWTIRSTDSEPGRAGVLHWHVILENATVREDAAVDLAIFSANSCTLRIIDNQLGKTLSDIMTREKCVAGVNGGYFSSDFAPVGLLISDGKMIAPLRRARLLTGVLFASSRKVQILRVGEFSRQPKMNAAIQCGPFLVDHYEHIRGLNDSVLARRTFAATGTNQRVMLGLCSEVSLADLATILATTPLAENFKIQRALNLDGGSSSAFWFARENGSAFSIPEEKSVRDFVAVVPR
jgi:exopolysaccharide biosynthesis protein